MADCCLIKKVATVEVYENKNEVRAYGFMAGDRNTPVMEVRFKHLWGESNLSSCKLRWIIVDDVGSLLVGEVPITSDNTALINLPNELFTGDRRMKVQLTVASCDGERILNLQQFTDLKVINSLAPNEVVEPVYQMLINQVYDDTKKYLAELETSYKAKYGSLESVYAKSKASLEEYLITAQNGGNAEFLQGYNPKNFNRVENTINELINSAGSKYKVGDVVEVLGYYTAGDGAHHKRIAKSEDDGSGEQGQNGIWWCIVHSGEINVSWFGAKDGEDITDILIKAFRMLSIKRYFFNNEEYLIDLVDIFREDEIEIIGNGTTLRFNPHREKRIMQGYPLATFARDGNSLADGMFNIISLNTTLSIKIKGIKFYSDVVTQKFDELVHHINIFGARTTSIYNCRFIGILGDGIAVSRGCTYAHEKLKLSNGNVDIRNNYFDGINCDNRQGISIYQAETTVIEGNHFYNLSRGDMPGAIDFESNGPEPQTKTLIVRGNYIKNNKGGVGAISIVKTGAVKQVLIENNVLEDVTAAFGLVGHLITEGQDNLEMNYIEIRNNRIINVTGQLCTNYNIEKVWYDNNIFKEFVFNDLFCHSIKAMKMTNNHFVTTTSNTNGLVFRVDADGILELDNNTFIIPTTALTIQGDCNKIIKNNVVDGNVVYKVVPNFEITKIFEFSDNIYRNSNINGDYVFYGNTSGKSLLSRLPNEFYKKSKDYFIIGEFPISYAGNNLGVLSVKVTDRQISQTFTTSELKSVWVRNSTYPLTNNTWTEWSRYNTISLYDSLDTPYYTAKMQQQGIYDDYIAYRDELHEYENSLATDETMLLPVLQEPVIPESVKAFAEKYKLI